MAALYKPASGGSTSGRRSSWGSSKDLILFAVVRGSSTPQHPIVRSQSNVNHLGSGTGGVSGVKNTNLTQFPRFISHPDGPQVVHLPIEGVGSNGIPGADGFAAAFGIGFFRRAVATYKLLVVNYKESNDGQQLCTIILAGYSRGAAIAIMVARLIDEVGLLIDDADDEVYAKLYKLSRKQEWSEADINDVKNGHTWRSNVRIDELLAFDCVDSLGVPVTGLGRALKVLPAWSTVKDSMMVLPSCVRHTTHVVMLQEPRGPYANATLCVKEGRDQKLRQVYFNGRHSDSMGLGSIAFVLEIFKTELGIEPNDFKVQKWFQDRLTATEGKVLPDWINNPIKRVHPFCLRLLGRKRRIPGRYSSPDFVTSEEIHSSVRHRGYGFDREDPAVPGFHPSTDPFTGLNSWSSTGTNSSSNSGSSGLLRVPEARIGDYERSLSKLPAN